MVSDIYKACKEGDIVLVQVLIETSPLTTNINCLESNGSTALHVASFNGHADIVRLLLHEYGVRRNQKNKFGLTAYDEAPTNEIRQLFHRPNAQINPFCTDADFPNPLEVINKESPRWNELYPSSSPILTAAYNKYTSGGFDVSRGGIIDGIKHLLGLDPDKKKIEKWSADLQRFVDKHLRIDSTYSQASECLEKYASLREIEHLFRLYTLTTTLCKHLAQNKNITDCLYAAMYFHLPNVYKRAYTGVCYRGLIMTENDFQNYRLACGNNRSYLRMNTFSSTSIDRSVAEAFVDYPTDQLKILMIINFVRSCYSAVALYQLTPDLRTISYYEDEQEVLILPGTAFSVTKLEEDLDTGLRQIYLEYYDTSEEIAEIFLENFHSQIDNNFLD